MPAADYTALLEHIADTGNLSKSCRETGVVKARFLEACAKDEALAYQYARAREVGLDTEADRAIEEAAACVDAAKGRLLLDARKWYLSKLLPKRYGDKTTTELTGADGGPVRTEGKLDVSSLTEDQLRTLASIKLDDDNR